MPSPLNLAQGFFNLSNPDPLSNLTNVVSGNIDLTALMGTPTSSLTSSLSLNNPTLMGEIWSQASPYINLPGINVPPQALALLARIPLPSNFTSRVPSTYSIVYPMPNIPAEQPSLPAFPMFSPPAANNSPLSKFLTAVRTTDFAFKSKYKVMLPSSVGITSTTQLSTGKMTAETISLFCENAEMPGLMFGTTPFRVYGPTFERPTQISYGGENMTLTFLVDQEFDVKKYFDSWMRIIADPAKYQFNYPDKYLSSGIIVTQIKHRDPGLVDSEKDIGVYSVRLIDAYPKLIIPMQLHGGDRDMHRLAVTFTYRLWVPAYGDTLPEFNYGREDFVGVQSEKNGSGEYPEE